MISKIRIAHLPTPVEDLPRLTAALSAALGGPQLLVKRDDQTGLAFGGNKTRKLEYLLAQAQTEGARTLITGGAVQSNHCRQTAAVAARMGFDCILVLSGEQPDTPSGNLLLDRLLGAEITFTTRTARDATMKDTFKQAVSAGRKPFLIPYGGSNPTGAAAYAYAVQELLTQQITPDWIVIPSSSGGTQAGLAAGAKLFGYPGKVLGISIDEPKAALQALVARLARETAKLIGPAISFAPEDILVNADYLGEGYGIMGEPEREAIRLFARHEGLMLDPVYTGRAAAALIDLVRKQFFSPDETVLFWHTGGTPALLAEKYQGVV